MSLRKGWCPGALRPMQTGDGFLVRLRLTGGIVSPARAQAIAGLALRFGNGLIDLTQRANLQLRGVREVDLPALTRALDGLRLTDANAEAEAVRNVIASPLAGLDPTAVLDIRPVVAALEARLSGDAALHALPGNSDLWWRMAARIRWRACRGMCGLRRERVRGSRCFWMAAARAWPTARLKRFRRWLRESRERF